MNFIKILFKYISNLFLYNQEGWYPSDKEPPADAQMARIRMKKKPYYEHTCVMCKRDFWSYKKTEVCFRIECYFKYQMAKGV